MDVGLKMVPGHFFEYDRALAKGLSQLGHEVRVYGYVGMTDDAEKKLQTYGKVGKIFRADQFEQASTKDAYAGEFLIYADQTQTLLEDLKQAEEADLWIWPSMLAQQLNACAQFGGSATVIGCIHDDPGIAQRTAEAMLWRHALVEARRRGLKYTVGSIESEIRHQFMSIVPDGRFALFPKPHDGPSIPEAKTNLSRIGFLGDMRGEKGRDLLGQLVSRLIGEGYEITIQDSVGRVKISEHPKVELLGHIENMRDAIARCDLVVLPYDVDRYRRKGSGILADCMVAGVPVVGPYATMPGRTIEQWGVGLLFGNSTHAEIFAVIKHAHQNYPQLAEAAFRAAPRFARQNGTDKFVSAMLQLAPEGP